MKVLVACEFSGVVRNAFIAKGHDVTSCDFCAGREPNADRHVRGDVRPLLLEPWDLVIAHPPCTYLCRSGQRWLRGSEDRWESMLKAVAFFKECLSANAPKVCVENSLMHHHAVERVGKHTQVIHPWQHGHPEKKSTCLWLKGLPLLEPTYVVSPTKASVSQMWEVPTLKGLRGHLRSLTFPGIAKAMAEQWG